MSDPNRHDRVEYGAPGRRVAVVDGLRTPFARAGTTLARVSATELGRRVVAELLARTELEGHEVQAIVFGTVVQAVQEPNIAREVSLLPQLPRGVQSFTVSRACASANQAITDAADQILLGHVDCAIAGGAESLSQVPVLHSRRMSDILVAASRAKSIGGRVRTLATIRPKDLVPVTPAIAEPSTGESMGQSAEKMAKLNGIARADQDAWALRSHRLAAQGTRDGRLLEEIAPLFLPGGEVLDRDNGVREDTSLDQLAKLPPVFDRKYGSVTAGNSSPLTDGAAAVLLMREDVARALGYEPLAYVRSYAYAALDPGEQLLQGPVLAMPVALARAGLSARDVDLVEIHEAFAAQVLSNLHALQSRAWAERAGFAEPVGELDRDRINVMGGSIAVGHPFGATGARVLTQLCRELRRRDGQFGMLSVCAAGGMGHVMIVERA
ncbi:acetyl-CoA C-acyltransferase FadI [Roseisolibacter sp. H3M3-2]|uniref:acetyl-CoA C-acyltransferase FadI n=1 Tax=Roseisolibacter sp. H3M3-2 TaxID=3031323 RepID=UPI0023D9AAE4|nr:acetyl-CoA C-acyltransferase FadI [Roseisolibacter sp. H3M3-2]MDF1503937.1 acetyl-CoA C-acyltransferase FadI [Roseisolibacter sp. H3M3-2]